MSGMITDLKATRETLLELTRIVKSTRQTLAAILRESDRPQRSVAKHRIGQFSETLQHLGEVREGFILSQRTSIDVSVSELRELVQHILLDWNWLQDYNLIFVPEAQIERVDHQLITYNHALVALSILPHLPAEAITFPQPQPSYGDVTVPALPGEKLARIEELESIIYQADVAPISNLGYAPLRRTYAFFEASSWLVTNYLGPLLDEI